MIRALARHDQLTPEPIAKKESARDRVVSESAERKTFS
jgi:hypothetical protein